MEQKVSFNYFYGSQADQYSFYRIPKALFKNDYFRGLSSDAKILYGLMLDRMSLSIKNLSLIHIFFQNIEYAEFIIEWLLTIGMTGAGLKKSGKNIRIKNKEIIV